MYQTSSNIPLEYLYIINQIFEIERKASQLHERNSIQKNVEKLKNHFEHGFFDHELELSYHNPIGEDYSKNRRDCEVYFTEKSKGKLKIVEVIKPIVRINQFGCSSIVQKGLVIVEGN